MLNQVILLVGALTISILGIIHLILTNRVVEGFGEIIGDNRNIITMEWILEGVSLIFIGLIVAVVTLIDPMNIVSKAVFWTCACELGVLTIVSFLIGFKVNHIAFKLSPIIFLFSSILLIIGILL